MQIRNLKWLAMLVSAMVIIDAFWTPIVLGIAALAPDTFSIYVTPIASSVDAAAIVVKLMTIAAFALWIYLAGANLVRAELKGLEYSPASRIWWFLVPIFSLFKPFLAMREMWNASQSISTYDTNSTTVSIWWALYLGGNVVSVVINATSGGTPDTVGLLINAASDIAVAAVAIFMINRITDAQRNMSGNDLADVFA